MRLTHEDRKMIRNLRRASKEHLFMPIFYTIIFGLVIFSVIILPETKGKIGYLVFSIVILAVIWTLYVWGKKTEKELKISIDEFEYELENGTDINGYLSDEQASKIQGLNRTISKYFTLFIVGSLIFSLTFLFRHLMTWKKPLTLVLLIVSGCLVFGSMTMMIIRFCHLLKYAETLQDDAPEAETSNNT